ncbi:hypothetical protein LguiA_017897 [Lonicera macranthoides]
MKFYKTKLSLIVFFILLLSVGFISGLNKNERISRSLLRHHFCIGESVYGCEPRRPGIP